jgi:sarcosine oxidase subunit beta
VVAAGHTSVLMDMADVRMPLESFPLQALVSEPVKPAFPAWSCPTPCTPISRQSDKGELVIGAGTDQYTSYSQRGGLHIIEHTLDAICEMFPMFTRMRMLRLLGRHRRRDAGPLADHRKTPVPGLYVNCGWGTGGFKATPALAHMLALDTMAKRRAAQDQRALHAGALHHRPPDRRGRRCGGGALMLPR